MADLRVDLHCSVVKLARHSVLHRPRLVFGQGQGAVVAAAYGHPGCLEAVLASRNVQPPELPEIAQSWGNVAAVLVAEPRLSKKGVQLNALKAAAPEYFAKYPVPSRRTLGWKDEKSLHYLDTKAFFEAAGVEVVSSFSAVPLGALLEEPPLLMWEHQGRCQCGRRSYLFGQCSKCLKEEMLEKASEEARRQSEEPEELPPRHLRTVFTERLMMTFGGEITYLGRF